MKNIATIIQGSSARQSRWLMLLPLCLLLFGSMQCKKNNGGNDGGPEPPPPPAVTSDVAFYLTTGTQTALLQKQTTPLAFTTAPNNYPEILVDSTQKFQSVDGFGFSLTDGSAALISGLPASMQTDLLNELFGEDSTSIGISYLRVSIGASDLSADVYTYNDMPDGQTDVDLQNFSLRKDKSSVVPLLKKILAINPNIKIMGSPWTAPVWMKTNHSSIGGSLLPEYYNVYAKYFVKYIQAMQAEGITIDAITVQNEPQHGGNNPSMVMSAAQQADFIKNHLGPQFKAAGILTKIICWDHNCDNPGFPIAVLSDPGANPYVDGSAFHLYAGDISALSTVHSAFPTKNLYFTEQYTASDGSFAGDLKWHLKNVVIGAMRNWSRNVLEWNLASDLNHSIHTPGGCTTCKGALTIASGVTRNVSYYIIAHASKFVPAGSYRIASNNNGSLYSVAFLRPDGKKVLIVENDGSSLQTFNLKFRGRHVTPSLDAGAVATFVW